MLQVSVGDLQSMGAGDGTFTDGVLIVSISQFNGTSFSWKSNISIDCIYAGTAGGGNFITYDLESLGEDNLGIDGTIVYLSFCYDLAPAQTPTPSPTLPEDPTPTPVPTTTPSMPDTSLSHTDPTKRSDTGGLLLGLLIIGLLSAGMLFGGMTRSRRPRASRALATGPWSTQIADPWLVATEATRRKRLWHR